jgi:hypothetical protein
MMYKLGSNNGGKSYGKPLVSKIPKVLLPISSTSHSSKTYDV